MKALCFILVLISSFSHWVVSKRCISLFSIIFLNAILCREDVSDMSCEPQEGEKHGHSQKLLKTIFWPVAGLHAQDEQEMTQFLPSGSWYLIWGTEKWNLEPLNAHEQARRKSFSHSSVAQNSNHICCSYTASWINRKAGVHTISIFYVLLHDFSCIKSKKAIVKEMGHTLILERSIWRRISR